MFKKFFVLLSLTFILIACTSNNEILAQCDVDRYDISNETDSVLVQGTFIPNENYLLEDIYEIAEPGAECDSSYLKDEDVKTLSDLSDLYPVKGGEYILLELPSGALMPVIQIGDEVFSFLLEEEYLTYDTRVIDGDRVKWDTAEITRAK
jgi:hypothetical protein